MLLLGRYTSNKSWMALVSVQVSMVPVGPGPVTNGTVDKNLNKAMSMVVVKMPCTPIFALIVRIRTSLTLVMSMLKHMMRVCHLCSCSL